MSDKIFKNKSAKDIFPALFIDNQSPELPVIEETQPKHHGKYTIRSNLPLPPDTQWFRHQVIEEKPKSSEDVQRALILTDIKDNLSTYTTLLGSLGYVVERTNSDSIAIEIISTRSCSLVVYESALKFEKFEQYMRDLSGHQRRQLLYIIVGSELKTLYDLEALSLSANAVVNSQDIKYIKMILRKVYHDYDSLFGPYLDILKSSEGSRSS